MEKRLQTNQETGKVSRDQKDKNGKFMKGKAGIRTQNEVTDDESDPEEDTFLGGNGDSEEED